MSFSPALVYDFIFLAVFSFAAVKSWQKGFLAGLAELIGAVLGVENAAPYNNLSQSHVPLIGHFS